MSDRRAQFACVDCRVVRVEGHNLRAVVHIILNALPCPYLTALCDIQSSLCYLFSEYLRVKLHLVVWCGGYSFIDGGVHFEF